MLFCDLGLWACLSFGRFLYMVLTAVAFWLFADENIDVAVIELVLGGPFLLKIEHILRGKASLMGSHVVSASDPGNRSVIKGIRNICGKPCISCDIVLEIDRDIKLFIELLNVNLCILLDLINFKMLQLPLVQHCAFVFQATLKLKLLNHQNMDVQ